MRPVRAHEHARAHKHTHTNTSANYTHGAGPRTMLPNSHLLNGVGTACSLSYASGEYWLLLVCVCAIFGGVGGVIACDSALSHCREESPDNGFGLTQQKAVKRRGRTWRRFSQLILSPIAFQTGSKIPVQSVASYFCAYACTYVCNAPVKRDGEIMRAACCESQPLHS